MCVCLSLRVVSFVVAIMCLCRRVCVERDMREAGKRDHRRRGKRDMTRDARRERGTEGREDKQVS